MDQMTEEDEKSLVDRLRAWDKSVMFAEEAHEAADELESWRTHAVRLNETIAALRTECDNRQMVMDDTARERDALRAELEDHAKYGISEIAKAQISVRDAELERLRGENERLRAALEKIGNNEISYVAEFARAALVSASEPTLAERKSEPSGSPYKNGLEPLEGKE